MTGVLSTLSGAHRTTPTTCISCVVLALSPPDDISSVANAAVARNGKWVSCVSMRVSCERCRKLNFSLFWLHRRFSRFELVTTSLRLLLEKLGDGGVYSSSTCFVTHATRSDVILGECCLCQSAMLWQIRSILKSIIPSTWYSMCPTSPAPSLSYLPIT